MQGNSLNIDFPVGNWTAPLTTYTIDFGDGTVIPNQIGTAFHTYSSPGIYTVTVSGNIDYVSIGVSSTSEKFRTVEQWGSAQWVHFSYGFANCPHVVFNATDVPNLLNTVSMDNMFRGSTNFNSPIGHWDVSAITNMSYMFFGANSFDQPLNNWATENVTDMRAMFYAATSFNQPIDTWDTSSVTNISNMFHGCAYNHPLPWDVSQVTDMNSMFEYSAFNQPIDNWDVSSVTTMEEMFYGADYNQPLNNWDVSSVTNFKAMFRFSEFNFFIHEWDVSSVTTMEEMFVGSEFNQPLNSWDVSSVTNMRYMFSDSKFNQPISDWDVSAVTNMIRMFMNSKFNQPLDEWDVSNVQSMAGMFERSIYNQPLNNWDVSSVQSMWYMFHAAEFNQPINQWDVTSVTTMENMFKYNVVFNQPLNDWNISGVLDMQGMFLGATLFNQDLSSWNYNPSVKLSLFSLENTGFLSHSGMNVSNYDSLLSKFVQLGLQSKRFTATTLKYCNVAARAALVQAGWIIAGDSLSANCVAGTDSFENTTLSLYPNPVKDILNVKLKDNVVVKGGKILDTNGRNVLSFEGLPDNLDLSGLLSGFYFISLETTNGNQFAKFIKE